MSFFRPLVGNGLLALGYQGGFLQASMRLCALRLWSGGQLRPTNASRPLRKFEYKLRLASDVVRNVAESLNCILPQERHIYGYFKDVCFVYRA